MLYDTTGVLSRSSSKHSNPHRILLLILPGGGGRALETSHRRPSTRCAERLCWTTAACEPRVCGFKNSFYSVELRTAWPKDAPLKVFFISDYIRFWHIIFKITYHEFSCLKFYNFEMSKKVVNLLQQQRWISSNICGPSWPACVSVPRGWHGQLRKRTAKNQVIIIVI